MSHNIRRSGGLLAACLLAFVAASCSLFAPSGGVSTMEVEELSNGYLVHIVTNRPVGEVSTVISSGNWLLITIADSLIAVPPLESFRSPVVDSVEVEQFPSALQISMHLTARVDAMDLIHRVPSNDIMISLFVRKEDPAIPD